MTRFIVNRLDPQLGEQIMDPATGTGGFLACAFDHVKNNYEKTATDHQTLQKQIHGVEKKQLPHLLCITNMMLHGIEVPVQIKHGNTLNKPLSSWDSNINVIATNPPFGGTEEDGIEKNFPAEMQTRETADLFLQLIIEVLDEGSETKNGGRAGVVLPDGTLFGEGVKSKIKEKLTDECNLHTIVRLPNGVFNPYTGIKTNILFFTKGEPTTDIWVYEHPYPEGVKNYSKTKPMKFEEFQQEIDWWGDESNGFADRETNQHAWKVDFKAIKQDAIKRAEPHRQKAENLKQQEALLKIEIASLKDKKGQSPLDEVQKSQLDKEVKSLQSKALKLSEQARAEEKTANDIYYAIFNFDYKNPYQEQVVSHDPDELLASYEQQQQEISELRNQLKGILGDALKSSVGSVEGESESK